MTLQIFLDEVRIKLFRAVGLFRFKRNCYTYSAHFEDVNKKIYLARYSFLIAFSGANCGLYNISDCCIIACRIFIQFEPGSTTVHGLVIYTLVSSSTSN